MSDIWVPVIAALLGALIPTLSNIYMSAIEPRLQRRRDLFQIRNEVYDECVQAIQDAMDHAHLSEDVQREHFQKLSKAKNRAAIYGSTEVATAMSDYYNNLVDSIQGQPLSRDQHESAHSRIVSAIRKDLEIEELRNFRLTSNQIPGKVN